MCKLTVLHNNIISYETNVSSSSLHHHHHHFRNVAGRFDVRVLQIDGSYLHQRWCVHFPEWTLGQTTLKEEAALFTSSSSILFCPCLSSSLLVNLTNQMKKKKSRNFNGNHDKAETHKALHCTALPFHLIRVVFGRRTWLVGGGRLCTGHWGWFQLIFCHEKEKHRGMKRHWSYDTSLAPFPGGNGLKQFNIQSKTPTAI